MSASGLDRYATARDAVVRELATLAATHDASWYGADADRAALRAARTRLETAPFVLAVVGEFSSGKSFLLNALLGKIGFEERAGSSRIVGLLATDINPSTATITELRYAPEETATAIYASGREERIPLGRLSRFVAVGEEAKLHDATGDESGAPTLVRVTVDSPFLQNGFVVADTPGLASINPAHRRATLAYLPTADAVLYLIDTQQPFTEGDASFLGIVRRYIESVFIVQTKIDLWRMREGEHEAWQNASARIIARAAVHSPHTPVFPLSAREYAEGFLRGDAALVEQSRFPEFLGALDASLVATAGRARLARTLGVAQAFAARADVAFALDAEAFALDPAALTKRRATLEPALAALDEVGSREAAALRAAANAERATLEVRGLDVRRQLERTIARAFDTADVARLRDRGKLHIIVDDTLAAVVGRFASDAANDVAKTMDAAVHAAVHRIAAASGDLPELRAVIAAVEAEPIALVDIAARRFDADPGSGTWSTDLATGLRSTIVLGAIGGPAVAFVDAIARRFSARQSGQYMKRELQADLAAELFPAFDAEIAAFFSAIAERIAGIYADLAAHVSALPERLRSESIGSIDRALAAHAANIDRTAAIAGLGKQRASIAAAIATMTNDVAQFAALSGAEKRADADVPLDLSIGTQRADAADQFDPLTYERGLRPERWRVVVLGAFKRGKSALINAIAGSRVLDDEGGTEEFAFPVHVRYGPEAKAYELGDDAGWNPIELSAAGNAATRTPVLIEVPWKLPRELVLVHAPAFDSGSPQASEIALAASSKASEVLALFSRQLSDRELELYGRVAEFGTPMTFVHTIADNEAATERRNVVMLADRYLTERGITPQRMFTVSTLEYRQALEEQRAPAAWNELLGLLATLESHADEHMQRLARTQRDRAMQEQLTHAPPDATTKKPGLFSRLFGRT